MDKIIVMKQKRADIVKKMRTLLDAATKETRGLSSEEDKEYAALRSEAEQLADAIVKEEELRSLEKSGRSSIWRS